MNKVILLGRLTKDVELRYTKNTNNAVASFSIAVNRAFVKQGEERGADFFNIVAWNKLAESISKYVSKGQQIAILGRLETRTWEDEQGIKHYVTEVIAEEVDFLERSKKQEPSDAILNGTSTPIQDFTNNSEDEEIMGSDDLPF